MSRGYTLDQLRGNDAAFFVQKCQEHGKPFEIVLRHGLETERDLSPEFTEAAERITIRDSAGSVIACIKNTITGNLFDERPGKMHSEHKNYAELMAEAFKYTRMLEGMLKSNAFSITINGDTEEFPPNVMISPEVYKGLRIVLERRRHTAMMLVERALNVIPPG
jgi:hypothetical protein